MAAALWQVILLGEAVLAAAIAGPLARLFGDDAILLAALWLGAFLLLQPLSVLGATALSRWAAPGPHRPVRARTVLTEAGALLVSAVRMSVPWRRADPPGSSTSRSATAGRPAPPVLLVHGILCNGAIWGPLHHRLSAAGCDRVERIDLQPPWGDIETLAVRLVQALEAMHRSSGGERIVIVAHSMGGLVARAALRAGGQPLIARIITLGTPHHGTAIACHLPFAPMRQMCPDSPWLKDLNAEQEGRLPLPVTCLYSQDDTLVVPPGSAALQGARHLSLEHLGHLQLASSPRALAQVLEELGFGS
jgi:pimeloyl-ACP methyl ester carboxylesterase